MEFVSLSQLIFARAETVPVSGREYALVIAEALRKYDIQEYLGANQFLTLKSNEYQHTSVRRLFGEYYIEMYEDERPHSTDSAENAYLDPYAGRLNRYGWLNVPSELIPEAASLGLARLNRLMEYAAKNGRQMPKSPEGRLPKGIGILAAQVGVTHQAYSQSVKHAMRIKAARAREGM